ncbi:hypothetical protein NRIC_12010 [Enterococcus florum]|uniref:DNA-directed RNA polymerase sigma-70 factor n=1 Tax=Enterococcus florum TaxID=2480627 RepID=A0A4P5P6D5_9ENTE|nr:sigma-70 family RNA polymerase sigma factor [Enterococcus florum]GCF93310.1 hypothetical protein NRIC_12010 [Enterococcus florum]
MSEMEKEKLLEKYQMLFYKVLHHCQVKSSDPNYEDYLQTLRILLLQTAEQKDLTMPDRSLIAYLFQLFAWRVRDLQRKEWRSQALFERACEEYRSAEHGPSVERLEYSDLIERIWEDLSIGEKRYIVLHCYRGFTISEIADYYRVSVQAVYRWRDRLRKRCRAIDFFAEKG